MKWEPIHGNKNLNLEVFLQKNIKKKKKWKFGLTMDRESPTSTIMQECPFW